MWARLQHKLRWLPHSRALRRAKVEMVGNKTKQNIAYNIPGRIHICLGKNIRYSLNHETIYIYIHSVFPTYMYKTIHIANIKFHYYYITG